MPVYSGKRSAGISFSRNEGLLGQAPSRGLLHEPPVIISRLQTAEITYQELAGSRRHAPYTISRTCRF
jgi:hypothetical protein